MYLLTHGGCFLDLQLKLPLTACKDALPTSALATKEEKPNRKNFRFLDSPHMFPEQEVEGVSRRSPNPDNNRVYGELSFFEWKCFGVAYIVSEKANVFSSVLDRNAMTWGRMSVYTCEGR
ncbi:unnamed protein product [Cylicocyclus nassatus]|uniref:Uncharacterized protein n=1 Tax=Cylicocyclus nassatus TaxID=53992 RepID=A0AA36GU49_CYLNA|nr:unnamed protein product [Cylicocyclus nassatus]